jgi:peroxiredoxin Q/BCP
MSEPGAKSDIRNDNNGTLQILAPFFAIVLIAGGLAAVYAYRCATSNEAPAAPPPQRDIAQEAREELGRRNFQPLSAPLGALLADPKYDPIPTQAHSLLLQAAPDFTLREVNGKEWSLSKELKDGPLVLIFYYGYHCNHCVSQLFALDKDIEKFRELGVKVVAVSADPVETTRERYKQYGVFKFPVLSDPDNKVAEKYEVYTPNREAGKKGDLLHGTFIVSRHGKIVWTNRGDEPFTENRTLLHEVASVEGRMSGSK